MRNTYNKGRFRGTEYGKISQWLRQYGNKKWRRTEQSQIEDELQEVVRFRKVKKIRRKTIRVKITREINGKTKSDYRRFYTRKELKSAVESPHVIRYFYMKTNKTNNK